MGPYILFCRLFLSGRILPGARPEMSMVLPDCLMAAVAGNTQSRIVVERIEWKVVGSQHRGC